ncbi:SMC-Scp complex subunit ScpB [Candidatus Margulisiibacteriota bacterium]
MEDQLSFDDGEVINISYPKLKSILESLLFVTKKPITVDEIRKVLRLNKDMIERSLHELIAEYSGKGVVIAKIAGGFQMVTDQENVKFVNKLLQSPIETTLSHAALETLAIVAYKQPLTRIDVENIRGVASDGVLQTLLEKKLVVEIGRGSGVGRPRLYGTTVQFLRHFGLKELADMPPFPKEEAGVGAYSSILPGEISDVQESEPAPAAKESVEASVEAPQEQEVQSPPEAVAISEPTMEAKDTVPEQPGSQEPPQSSLNEQ